MIENQHWSIDPELTITQDSARELVRAQSMLDELFENRTLSKLGFNANIEHRGRVLGHITRVCVLSLIINERLMETGSKVTADVRKLASSALLHDIGKFEQNIHDTVFTPERILADDHRWKIIRTHPSIGCTVPIAISKMSETERRDVSKAIEFHHEMENGEGYYKKKSDEIPLESKVIAVADAIDVMLGSRKYSNNHSIDGAITEVQKCTWQFNSDVAKAAEVLKTNRGRLFDYHTKDRGN